MSKGLMWVIVIVNFDHWNVIGSALEGVPDILCAQIWAGWMNTQPGNIRTLAMAIVDTQA